MIKEIMNERGLVGGAAFTATDHIRAMNTTDRARVQCDTQRCAGGLTISRPDLL